jgi:hypothetical protein
MTNHADPVDRRTHFVPTESSDPPRNRLDVTPRDLESAEGEQTGGEHEAIGQFDLEGFELLDVADQESWLVLLSGC